RFRIRGKPSCPRNYVARAAPYGRVRFGGFLGKTACCVRWTKSRAYSLLSLRRMQSSGGAAIPIFTRRPLPPSSVISIGPLANRSFSVSVLSTPSASLIWMASSARLLTTSMSLSRLGSAERARVGGCRRQAAAAVEIGLGAAAQRTQCNAHLLAASFHERTVALVLLLALRDQVEQPPPLGRLRGAAGGRRDSRRDRLRQAAALTFQRVERLD